MLPRQEICRANALLIGKEKKNLRPYNCEESMCIYIYIENYAFR